MKPVKLIWVLILIVAFGGVACSKSKEKTKVKNVILFIGDGFGAQQLGLASQYARLAPETTLKDKKLNLEKLIESGEMGLMHTEAYMSLVTDSAASATQIGSGQKSWPETVGLDFNGDKVDSLLIKAKRAGKSTGLVSDMRITHATPAAFASHQPHRRLEGEIASDILSTQPDVIFGGGLKYFLPKDTGQIEPQDYGMPEGLELESGRTDHVDLIGEAKHLGYELVYDYAQMKGAKTKKILGLFSNGHLPDPIAMTQLMGSEGRGVPLLKDMVAKSLDVLSSNPKGFFLMVEEGQIDTSAHKNDAGAMLHGVLHLDSAIGFVMDWAKGREDTLIVVTGDHETGSFSMTYQRRDEKHLEKTMGYFRELERYSFYHRPAVLDRIYNQRQSFNLLFKSFRKLKKSKQTAKSFRDMANEMSAFQISKKEAKEILDLTKQEKKRLKKLKKRGKEEVNYALDKIRGQKYARIIGTQQGIAWGHLKHSSTPVPVMAWGPTEVTKSFDGLYHSTKIHDKIMDNWDIQTYKPSH